MERASPSQLLFMLSLIIDTSTDTQLFALSCNQKIVIKALITRRAQPSKETLLTIQNLLKEAALSLGDLDCVAVGVGPGSFTGTRCGVMVGRTLAYGLSLPIIPFYSHLLYTTNKSSSFWVASDAKSGMYYLSLGRSFSLPDLIKREKLPRAAPILCPPGHTISGAIEQDPDPSYLIQTFSNKNYISPLEVEIPYLRHP